MALESEMGMAGILLHSRARTEEFLRLDEQSLFSVDGVLREERRREVE
jgi:hypothetical protein